MTLCINNLDAPLGAEVRGIDVSHALTPAEVEGWFRRGQSDSGTFNYVFAESEDVLRAVPGGPA